MCTQFDAYLKLILIMQIGIRLKAKKPVLLLLRSFDIPPKFKVY